MIGARFQEYLYRFTYQVKNNRVYKLYIYETIIAYLRICLSIQGSNT